MYRLRTSGFVVGLGLIGLLTGCTHDQLRYDSLRQAQVASQFQQQQVLDNLAQFVVNPNAVPYYTVISAGQAQVNDTGSAQVSPNWEPHKFTTVGSMFSGSRTNQENFAFAPVTDPYKLTWMRCAYQAAVGKTTDPVQLATANSVLQAWTGIGSVGCPGSAFSPSGTEAGRCDSTPCNLEPPCGAVLPGPGWYCVGSKHDVPKGCTLVGRCGAVYVWVPDQGTDEFARLTLAIIGFSSANRSVSWNKTWSCPPGRRPASAPDEQPAGAQAAVNGQTPEPVFRNEIAPIPDGDAKGQGCIITVTTSVGSAASASSGGQSSKGGAAVSPNMAPPVIPIVPSTLSVP